MVRIIKAHEERKQDLKGTNTMKTKEELDALKKEVEELNEELQKLDDKELAQVTGGESGFRGWR